VKLSDEDLLHCVNRIESVGVAYLAKKMM